MFYFDHYCLTPATGVNEGTEVGAATFDCYRLCSMVFHWRDVWLHGLMGMLISMLVATD